MASPLKLPRIRMASRLSEIRALVREGGVICETPSGPGGPTLSTLIQMDGDMVTMIGPHTAAEADALIDRHIAEVTAFFTRTLHTLRLMFYGAAALLTGTVVAMTAVAVGWWQALVGLLGGALAGVVSRLLAAAGRATPLARWATAAAGAVIAVVAAVFDRPVVAWLFGLGLVVVLTVSMARLVARGLIRGRLGRS